MDPLKHAKSADNKSEMIVFGYVHEIESKLELPEIASFIFHIILGFYCHDEFITKYLGESFKVSSDRLTIENLGYISFSNHAIYLNQWIQSISKSIHKWTFKMNNITRGDAYFGWVGKEFDEPIMDLVDHEPYYIVNETGSIWTSEEDINDDGSMYIEKMDVSEGDLVTFTLDLKQEKTFIEIHDKGKEVEMCNVATATDIEYKFAFQIRNTGKSVTLLDYRVYS